MPETTPACFLDAVAPFRTLRLEDIPHNSVTVARQSILDWFGCALAGSREPLSQILRDELATTAEARAATIVGTDQRTSARTAALINGAAGHALDYDDTHTAMTGHPTVPILPGLLALAEEADAPGGAVLAAFAAGVEVACRLGLYIGREHYRLGWHPTGTIGTIGAAAAAAHLLSLDDAGWRNALNLAATQSAGLKASFGSMAKPLHAGKAASDGLFAARLASRGFVGSANAFEGSEGMVSAAAGGKSDPAALAAEGRWLIDDMLFKYHASCYLTHAAINAAASLRESLDAGQVASAEVRVHPSLMGICGIPEPASGLELKFSLRATVAMALLGVDTSDTSVFTEELARSPQLIAIRDRISVSTDSAIPSTAAVLTVLDSGGESRIASYDTGAPERDLVHQGARLSTKFRGLAAPVIGSEAAREIESRVECLQALPSIREVLTLARTPPGT